jgi:thioredoxin-dependent peroxiredoxin
LSEEEKDPKKMQLKVGDKAPLFEGMTDNETKFSLGNLIGKSNIILYFYPKDMTSGCTAEACGFRDNWDRIISLGATVIGVSSQGAESHREFKGKNNLPFPLLSDPKNEIRKLYGATGFLIPPRVTFVIDKAGLIRYILNSQLNVTKHVKDALENLEKIEKSQQPVNV